jgi:dTDP-4-amino-4,6-dideoxygalactose transaminase
MKISFSPPRIDQITIEEVKDTLLSGWITTGPKTKLFEEELAKYIGVKEVVCLNSGTAGLQMAMNWLGIKSGDEVIVPSYTYCATANVVLQFGAKPIMAEINYDDFNINTSKIKRLITKKTKAIIAVDLGGFPADYLEIKKIIESDEIKRLFNSNNDTQKKLGRIALISDAAHSIGAEYYGEKTGNYADMSSFSFHAVKNLTSSEGGALAFNLPMCFDDQKIKQHFKSLSVHGQSKDALSKNLAGGWEYDVIHPGFKCNMTDINASIGLVELRRYNETLKKKKRYF